MHPTPVTALKELRIDTAVSTPTLPIDTESELPAVEAAQLSPKLDRVRHHLIPARTNTCVRAPCLKRQVSVPVSSISLDLADARCGSASGQDRVASNPLPTSFAAPRNLVLQSASRHVHFDEAPPEEFYVLSGESYDRRPIKCTQGGSEFDMSLPPRSKSYNGDDSNDDDASSTDDAPTALEPAEEPALDVGFFHDPTLENWACIKNGTVIASVGYQPRQQPSGLMASGKSLHFSALSSSQHASALNRGADPSSTTLETQPGATSQKVSLPVHGFRSFGGLQNSLAPQVTATVATPVQPVASPKHASSPEETTPPSARKLSPDATPMPSPSLHKSIGAFTSVGYFGAGSDRAQSSNLADSKHARDSSNDDTVASSQNALGIMEVLRDAPASTCSDAGHDFLIDESSLSNAGFSSPTGVKPACITVKMPESSARSTPRRMGLERRMAEKDAVRISSLHPSASANGAVAASSSGWSNLLGVTWSPLSSRCSSVDPWSSLSSDGDGDGTESPCNETSWISSNCTSPDLGPFEQVAAEGFNHKNGLHPAPGSTPSWLEARNIKHVDSSSTLSNGALSYSKGIASDLDHELNTPKSTDFADETRFSSSVETVNTMSWEHKRLTSMSSRNFLGGISSGDVSTLEATTPDSSRRPSFHHNDTVPRLLSPRLRTSFADHDSSAIDTLDEDDSQMLRVRSHSRDGHVKKKSTKCRYCRSLRQRIKGASTESWAPTSSGGSAQITDAEEDAEGKSERLSRASAAVSLAQQEPRKASADFAGSTEVSEMEDEDGQRSRSSVTQLRSSVRSPSVDEWSSNASRSRSRDRSALSRVSATMDAQHDRESSNSPGESCSESPHLLAVNLPMVCTCDKKREKERIKKKIRKERELERQRDREWERDQARGRQKKLFGESFGDADTSCLSALDGF
ncbi:uncharacterized protein SPSC_04365 [Sporisorium scitamineum]|uniref:Uncharacterized protein n=1 Tax=Sporisorium scitamineum TaxID=49012 RepID=A0A0F7S1Z8_9BASI|nr:uncharacterized protein SPSC_04365 [Sporisorium scitamineum]CDS00982.1 hypothetical protein [Sporisorium scitamineum]